METTRRRLLASAGLLAGALPVGQALATAPPPARGQASNGAHGADAPFEFVDWERLRDEFELDYSWRNFAGFLLASHPRIVEQEIQRLRAELNRNPPKFLLEGYALSEETRDWAGRYLGVSGNQIALTDSTTMGLATLYNGISIRPDQEVLTTEHEHYSSKTSLAYRAKREGFTLNTIRLYDEPREASTAEILARIEQHVSSKTRVLALTWVHSGSSIKLPVAEIGELVAKLNATRGADDRLLYCVDGVHAFGVEDLRFDAIGCDYLVAGTHKWLFGPRGTGIICSRDTALEFTDPTIPPFNFTGSETFGPVMTPGGFHSFEHRWALRKAFEFQLALGKANVQARIQFLNTHLKTRLLETKGVELVTPLDPELSAGFTFFRVPGHKPEDIQQAMLAKKIIVSPADRDIGPVVRMAPGILNSVAEIDEAVEVLGRIA